VITYQIRTDRELDPDDRHTQWHATAWRDGVRQGPVAIVGRGRGFDEAEAVSAAIEDFAAAYAAVFDCGPHE
jgi:hypothetical protein